MRLPVVPEPDPTRLRFQQFDRLQEFDAMTRVIVS